MQRNKQISLADVPNKTAVIVSKINKTFNGRKKLSDIGIISGTEIEILTHALFGGLIIIKLLDTTMTIHQNQAKNILVNIKEKREV